LTPTELLIGVSGIVGNEVLKTLLLDKDYGKLNFLSENHYPLITRNYYTPYKF